MIRILVNGAQGKMGSLASKTLQESPDFTLVGELGRGDDLAHAIGDTKAEVVLDLTRADSVFNNALTIIKAGARPVIGTSGLVESQIYELKNLCSSERLGGLIVPNFSIGAVLMMHFAAKAAQWINEVEIIETHHQKKLDSPSGTEIKTEELIAKNRKKPKNTLPLKSIIPGVRGGDYQDVSIHSLRLPGIHARQEVIFGEPGETLTIIHDCADRAAYMPGVLLACREVMKLQELIYGLDEVMGLYTQVPSKSEF